MRTILRIPCLRGLVCVAILQVWCSSTALANLNKTSTDFLRNKAEAVLNETPAPEFQYQLEGRPDPFKPFISETASTQNVTNDDIVDENIELTGMRQFEPGQLTLVAIMHNNSSAMGMVEDVTGKGYFIKTGMAIGRRGVITQIDKDQVTITETAHTRAGRKLQNTIVMRLNKEGDK